MFFTSPTCRTPKLSRGSFEFPLVRFRWSRTCLLDPGHGPRDVDRLLTDKAQDIKKGLWTVVRLDRNRSLDSAFDNRERLELDIDISESSTTNGDR